MKIDKILKKQKKYNILFFTLMIFLGIFLPLLTYLAYIKSLIIIALLALIEILIFIAIINKINSINLNFTCSNNRLRFKSGVFNSYTSIQCDKIAIVHTNKSNEEMEIILITTTRNKGRKSKIITKGLLKKYKEVEKEYLKAKRIKGDSTYYFEVIKNGEFNKYILLDTIYKNCVIATYTSSAIENIKIARGQKEI